ncbi:hypothetical protein [Ekhidna sp.]|uniref:hypothetical protein n=1 Tax=Ekhidna sp. TaxID=2608089 RepID=UPI003513523A
MNRSTYLTLIITLSSFLVKAQSINKKELLGSYTLKEINYIYKDTTIRVSPSQDGFLILSQLRYAIAYNPGLNPRVPFQNLSNPAEEEILAGFRSFAFNSGSYKIDNNNLIATPDFAKVPGFEGGEQIYSIAISNDQLSLTMFDETYPSGEKPSWFGKLEIQLIFEKEARP